MATHRDRTPGRWCSLALLFLAATAGAAPPQSVSAPQGASARTGADPHRLDRSVLPDQYTLHFTPDLDSETFKGRVVIEVTAQEAVNPITLHSVGIEFEKVTVTLDNDDSPDNNLFVEETFHKDYEKVDLVLKENLKPNEKYTITIRYNGILRDDMYGFYLSTYGENGPEKKLAATQFQATHARKAFPCFDEPNFKARFQVTVVAPPGYGALSNMPEKDQNPLEDTSIEYIFENSLKMSSYLVAFVVSQFVPTEEKDNGIPEEVTFKTWTRPNAIEWSQYSLDVSRSILKVLEEYTGIPYIDHEQDPPLKKVDQVALPDFSAGAMENWGLITYRETALLFNDGSADAKKRVATVIAHELLHMWFGNLVTTFWWDTTWLNEGFARYFQYFITSRVEKEWRMWDQFLVDQHQMVFALDSLVTADALTHDVSTAAEASASFGTITYSKGGSVLRMISFTIGEDNFQNALQNYLQKHKYNNVEPQDLFDELKPFADKETLGEDAIEEFLKSWTEQPGFPIVTVTRDYGANSVSISQKRFLYKGTSDEKYIIPLTWTQEGGSFDIPKPSVYLQKQGTGVINDIASADKWVIFNVRETGYYRVNYDSANWNLISKYLNDRANSLDGIHVLNRAQLLDDALNLARAGELDYDTAFGLADYLSRETDYVPLSAALTAFSYLDRMLVNHPKYPVFKRYVLRLIDRAYGRLETTFYTNDSPERHDEKLLINRLGTWACSLDHELCQDHAKSKLVAYLDRNERVDADQRSVVYCHGIRSLPNGYWSKLWKLYQESDDDVERGLIIGGLACSSDERRLEELLHYSIAGADIRKQDASSVFTSVYANPLGVNVALDFLDENFAEVLKYYGSMGSINNIVTGIAGRLTTEDQRKKLAEFVTRHESELGTSGDAALATVDDNLQWLSDHEDKIFEVLETKELKQYRLPEWVTPTHYSIRLEPDLDAQSFKGEVSIEIKAIERTETIILHAEGIDVHTCSVKSANAVDSEDVRVSNSFDKVHEFLKIELSSSLTPKESYIIEISFSGTLRDNMYGFYLSTYENEQKEEVKLAATQFQPTHARKAFPCFDEPNFKATFTVTIKTPAQYNALGNMPVASTEASRDDTSTDITFERTPLMSTYLLAFVVSDFVELEDKNPDGEVKFRTWTRANALDWAAYSIQVSRPLLETLEDYTGIKYIDNSLNIPFDKVDQVALPDFSAGAMENWGLITYRETALLYNDGTASARKSVATIIAHELAHMWFGNLVTTRWWDATWLNEGFAQYLQFYATSKVETDWRLMDQFVVDHHQGVFASDSLATAAALTAPAYTPSQVSARFGTITYSKGASILRMLSALLGENNFRQTLETYLQTHRYSTTVPADLFKQLINQANAANLDESSFEALLLSWTEKPGFPVVKVTRNYDARTVGVSQTRFFLKTPQNSDPTLYYVPLTWTAQGGDFSIKPPEVYLTNTVTSGTINGMPEAGRWIIFNVQETGYYRVNYDPTNWKLLSDYLRNSNNPLDGIHVLNRAQLLDDAFNLARAGQLEYETVFKLSDYLERETDYIPWASAFAAFSYLQRMLISNEKYYQFENYVLRLLRRRYEHFNFQDQESHIEKLLLNRVTAWACSLGHSQCKNSATSALQRFLDSDEKVPADLRSVVYCYGVRHSEDTYWDKLLEEYKTSLDNAERALLMAGLACSQREEKLKALLEHSISGQFIRKQDASSVFTSVYSNSDGVQVALDFLDENFDEVHEYYGSMGAINNIVIGIAGRLTTDEQKAKMEDFVEKHRSALGATADAALETVDENLEWLKEHGETIIELLSFAVSLRATALVILLSLAALRLF